MLGMRNSGRSTKLEGTGKVTSMSHMGNEGHPLQSGPNPPALGETGAQELRIPVRKGAHRPRDPFC